MGFDQKLPGDANFTVLMKILSPVLESEFLF